MSATGQAAGGGTAGGDGGAQGGDAAQGPGFDAQALQQQLQGTQGGVDDLRQQFGQFQQQMGEFMQTAPWAQQEPEGGDGIDLSFLDQGLLGDPAYGEAERAQMQQQFAQSVEGLVQERLQQALTPLQEQQQEMVRQQQARDLVAEHPELQDREVAEAVVRQAQQVANDMGQPELANNPQFWKLIHQASRATATANAEQGAESPTAAHLEGGGGSGPAGGQQVDIAGSIIGARKGASVLPFA